MQGLRSLTSNLFRAAIKMLWPVLFALFVLLVGLVIGCTPVEEPSPGGLMLDKPAGELSPNDEPAQEGRDEQYPLAVTAGIETVSRNLGAVRSEVDVISYYQTEWQDGCLGLGEVGEFCTQEIVSGWHITLSLEEYGEYEVRTNEDGRNVRWHRLQ